MKRGSGALMAALIALVMTVAAATWAADVEGKIKSVDASGKIVTLDDGTQLTIPQALAVERKALQPGANVKATYEERDGQKIATSFMVMSAR
jgi:hypothetical protein